MFDLNPQEFKTLKKLTTPARIQDFLNSLKINFEPYGDTSMSPRRVLREKKAHCMEGAVLAALALRIQGHPPLVMDLKSTSKDFDHVVAPFKINGFWGAINKTNHAVLRYREPVYKSIRELAMSYFHEYFLDNGVKTLRSYSRPLNLARFDSRGWTMDEKDIWYIPETLDEAKHYPILTPRQIRNLRKADQIEIEAGKLVVERK